MNNSSQYHFPLTKCEQCKYRHDCEKHGRDITACSKSVIDLNIIREMLSRRNDGKKINF